MISSLLIAAVFAAASPDLAEEADAYDRKLLEELAGIAPDSVEEGRLAAEAYRAERHAEAIERYERVLRAAPGFSHALRRLCSARSSLGQRSEALELCSRALAKANLAENEIALAAALVRTSPPENPTPAERVEACRLAASATDRRPDDFAIAGLACDVATRAGDAVLLETCSARMARLAPEHPGTRLFGIVAAMADGRLDEARRRLAVARSAGMPPELVASLDKAIDESEPPVVRYGIPASIAVVAWLAVLLGLIGLGAALSSATLRAAGRIARASQDAPARVSRVLRRVYAGVLWATCTYYYVSIPIVLVGVLAGGAGVLYAFLALGRIPVKLLVILAIVVLVTAWAILKGVWVSVFGRRGEGDPGVPLDPTGQPRLGAALREVAARVGTRPVDVVFLLPGTDVGVFERGRMLRRLAGHSERCLLLGVGALDGMSVGELKAILAHEYGHFVNRDTAGGGFALSVRRSVLEMARTLAEGGAATWYNPAWWFVNGFHRVFLRISQGASRLQEILADRWAALAYGGAQFGRGLRHVVERSVRFGAHAQRTIKEVIDRELPLANFYAFAPAEPPGESEMAEAVAQALAAPPSPYDSHPRPEDRIAWVADIVAPADARDDAAAWGLFEDREAIERRMTEEIRAAVRVRHGVDIPVEAAGGSVTSAGR